MARINILGIKPELRCNDSICYLELLNKNYCHVGVVKFDKKLLPEVIKHKWHKTTYGYVESTIKGKNVKFHNLILPSRDGFIVDHIDRNPQNNTRNNLRYATHAQNMRNRSNVKGVFYDKDTRQWRICLTVDGKRVHPKRYKTKKEALNARKILAPEHFGEFAPE